MTNVAKFILQVILLTVLVLILISITYYLFNSSSQRPEPLSISPDALRCVEDADCVLYSSDCEDCTFATVHKNYLDTILSEKKLYCTENPPKVMCDMTFGGKIKCLESKCTILP